jgi:hypothetical protein
MWFTKVSLKNPVFATMLMLAFVVLGLFSYQRLKIDQFPNIDFPVVVITTEYPGASPEIVESEVSKKIEEGVNSIAGISALTSRSYEGMSVVVIEFQLHIDGRKGADDVREKVAALRPTLRTDVKEPKVLRFDPSSRAIWSLAVVPETPRDGKPLGGRHQTRNQFVPQPASHGVARHQCRPSGERHQNRNPRPARGQLAFVTTRPCDSNPRSHAAPRRLWPNHRGAQKHHRDSTESSGHCE